MRIYVALRRNVTGIDIVDVKMTIETLSGISKYVTTGERHGARFKGGRWRRSIYRSFRLQQHETDDTLLPCALGGCA